MVDSPQVPGPDPAAQFAAGARRSLAPVAGDMQQARQQAQAGGLRIDHDAARVLIEQIRLLKERAADLVAGCGELDVPLRFGDNWVGAIMSERLRRVAVDEEHGVTSVLETFHQVLSDLEATVRFAAGLYQATDESAALELQRAAQRLGLAVGGAKEA